MDVVKYKVMDLFNIIRNNKRKYLQSIINEYLNYINDSNNTTNSSSVKLYKRANKQSSKRKELRNSIITVFAIVVVLIIGIYILYIVVSFVGRRKRKKIEIIAVEVDDSTINEPMYINNNSYLQQNSLYQPSAQISHTPSIVMASNRSSRPISQIYTPNQSYYSSYSYTNPTITNIPSLQNHYPANSNYQPLLNYPPQCYNQNRGGIRHSYSAPFYQSISSMALPPPNNTYNTNCKRANSFVLPQQPIYNEPTSYNTNGY